MNSRDVRIVCPRPNSSIRYRRVVPQGQAKAMTQLYDRLLQGCPGPTNGYIFQPQKDLLALYCAMTRSCNRLRGNAQIIDLRVRNGYTKPTITISQMMMKALLQAVTLPSSPTLPVTQLKVHTAITKRQKQVP
jgi:hypothetical protein